jgi:hypothetical protein
MMTGTMNQRNRAQRHPRADGQRTRGAILRTAASLATVDGLEGLTVSQRADPHPRRPRHITCAWVSWYNSARLMHRLGRRPPAEVEAEYYSCLHAGKHTSHR